MKADVLTALEVILSQYNCGCRVDMLAFCRDPQKPTLQANLKSGVKHILALLNRMILHSFPTISLTNRMAGESL